MITDSCTMKAVFELDVPLSASMQKILLNIQKHPILIPIMTVFLLMFIILLKNIIESERSPPSENTNRIVKYGRYPRSILDHMYEEPHRIAFSNRKAEAFRSFIIFITLHLLLCYHNIQNFCNIHCETCLIYSKRCDTLSQHMWRR